MAADGNPTPPGPGLLVSVRNLAEARLVADCPLTVIDLKEPAAGPLGAANPQLARRIGESLPGTPLLSLAMGELSRVGGGPFPWLAGYSWAKAGLSAMADRRDWQSTWRRWAGLVRDQGCQPVAVAYADPQTCTAPPLEEVAALALSEGVPWMLVDTWTKDGRTLLNRLAVDEIQSLAGYLHSGGTRLAVAGSLGLPEIRKLIPTRVDMIGVRGSVCQSGDRGARLDRQRVDALLQSLAVAIVPSGTAASVTT